MKYFIMILLSCILLGCAGNEGPAGPVGPAGPAGQPGPQASEISFSMTFAKSSTTATHYLSLSDSGAVVAQVCVQIPYLIYSAWTPLPYTDATPGYIPTYLESKIVYGFLTEIHVEISRADNQDGWPFIDNSVTYNFKALLIK
jgi:hypothetical protein